MLQAMREPEVFECMALDCLEHLGATRDNESSDDEEYKGQEASEACHWYSKGMLALQESKQVRRGRSEAQWEAVRAALGERGMQLQADGSWFPSWDDASEVGYLSGAEVEAQAVQAAMLISLQESTELEVAVEASVEAATAMEVQEVSAEQQNELCGQMTAQLESVMAETEQQNELCGQMTAQLESVMAETERIEHEQWADYVFAEDMRKVEADVRDVEVMQVCEVVRQQEVREEMLEARPWGAELRLAEEEISMQLAMEASLRGASNPTGPEVGAGSGSGSSPDTVTCVDAELQGDQQRVDTRAVAEHAYELATTPAEMEGFSRAWASRQVAQWEKGQQVEWYTVQTPEGGVTVEAVRGSDAEAFFERLDELSATAWCHGQAEEGKARAYAYAATLGGDPEPVQQRQMPDKAKAATARGAALGWAMQGAERWAGEIDLMELDSEEEPLDEIEKIMDSGGPELEELERALDGGVEGGNDAVPEEVGAGLLGEPEVCAEVKAVAYEPSMDELELVAELWQSTLSGWRSWRSRRS